MTIEEQVMEVREKQAFWQGVVRGVIGSAVFFEPSGRVVGKPRPERWC